jgi:BirA family transcriptional regulator, biotin operon repressor / biotin---[acetyl-CoA-carboxylase] ligase
MARAASPFQLVTLKSADSTNNHAAELLKKGAVDQTVVTAKVQTAGRGRYGREWVSEEGNLFASLILKPVNERATWGQAGFVISLSIAEALLKIMPERDVRLKWPNDVLVAGRKIAGVLLEIKSDAKGNDALIAGFGVNCNSHPANTDTPATNLAGELGADIAPEKVLEGVLEAFEGYYALWQEKGFPAIRPAWLALAKDLKKQVSVRFAGKEIKGEFVDIGSDDGALYIKKADGETERLSAGDVYFGTN